MEIRLVCPEEYDAVAEVTVSAYDAGGFVPRGDPYAERLADVADRARSAETWVAIEDDQIVGAVTYCPIGSSYREIALDDTEAEFRMLAVSPGSRGHGAGEALVRHCLNRAVEDGHARMVMCTMSRMTDAHRLYDRLGFEPLPERDWAPHGTEQDVQLLAYVKDLGPGS